MPNCDFITVSQKIEDEKEKKRLIECVREILPKNNGAIIRTSAVNVKEEEMEKDLRSLIEEWEKICELNKKGKAKKPMLVYDNMALLRRTVIDIIDQSLNKIIVNDEEIYENVLELLKQMEVLDHVKIEIRKNENLLELYSLRNQIEKLENRKIWLKCGGFITIDRTEALTAIDVNTAKYIGTKSFEKTIYNVNKEATTEIAKQLRLRDIGGIIIIDYIDMEDKKNEKDILDLLNQSLKKDRTRCQVLGFTKLNLLEMTRKNMCNNDDSY